jgi:aspartate aminotransferase
MQSADLRSTNRTLDAVPLSAFEDVEDLIDRHGGGVTAALHQGKTTFEPCVGQLDRSSDDFGLLAHEHAPPAGAPALRNGIVRHLRGGARTDATEQLVIVTCGATHGIGLALRAVLEPGDEVLVLSPQWLFASGLVEAAGGHTVEVPVFLELQREPDFDLVGVLDQYRTVRTRAIYFNSPNNPTGTSLDRDALNSLAEFAARHNLWIIADNAYENYEFSTFGFIDIGMFPAAADRTFSVYTFSKTYAMPGYRVGFMVVPDTMSVPIRKWALFSVYAVSTVSQFAALQALATPSAVLDSRRDQVRGARDLVTERLDIPHTAISGGLYTFLDVSDWPGGTADFLEASVRAGVSLAPGIAFGSRCSSYARMCFTAVDVARLEWAIGRLNAIWEGHAR